MLLDLDALAAQPFRTDPPRWQTVTRSFRHADSATALAAEYPTDGFEFPLQRRILAATNRLDQAGDGRRFRSQTRVLLESGDPAMLGYLPEDERVPGSDASWSTVRAPETLTPSWRQLAEDLLSDAYRELITELSGIDVRRS